MKKLFAGTPHAKFIVAASAFIWTIAIATSARGMQLQAARVTQVVNDVKVLLEKEAPRPVALSDVIRHGTAVSTGTQSRGELTFDDLTITRLGTNTTFSFKEGTRQMNLVNGAILFQVPKGSGGATIRTVGVTAAITGTTGIGEFHPATTSHPQPFSKWLCLEGTFRLYLPNGQSLELGPGKMVTTDGKSFSTVLTFDIAGLVSTSLFFTGFDRPLPSLDLIVLEEQKQLASMLLATTTTNPLDPTRIVNVISQAIVAEEAQTSPSESPTPPVTPTPPITPTPPPPTPSKFGTPSVITSPVPYLITNGTVITTDPSITTNGVIDFGKIYRGQANDGAFTLWAFGSTSAFDTALGIDDVFFADPNHLPIATFKFQSLSLTGNPTIDTSNGVTKLALIGVDGITSGPPGGTLTFTGLDLLLLATVNGSINLTSDVSFQDLNELAMYARGAGSDLILDSPISNIGILELAAEGSIQLTNPGTMSVGEFDATAGNNLTLQIGGSLLLDGKVRLDTLVLPGTTVASGANLTLNVTGDYTNSSATEFSRLRVRNEGAHIGTGGNIDVSIGGNLTTTGTAGDFALVVQNTNGQIDNGGNIALTVNGSISTGGELNLLVENYNETDSPAGHIGTGGNLSLTTGGDLTADFASIAINNRGGGVIDSAVNLTINIAGALTTLEDGPDFLGNSESLSLAISSRYDNNTAGSFIGGDATLLFHSDSASIGGLLDVVISDRGGTIDGNALLNFSVTHDITVQEDASWEILNDSGPESDAASPIGGTIHGNATLVLSANNLTVTKGSLDVDILNKNGGVPGSGGTIDSDATITFNLTGNLTTQNAASFSILNQVQPGGTTGGSIGGNATINVTAANITANSLLAQIANTAGTINGNAAINMNVSGSATVTNDATVAIFGNDPAGSAEININGSYDVGGTFLSRIDGNGTITFDNAGAHADVLKAGVFGTNGVLNVGGGGLSADTTLKLYAPGSNGQLNFLSNVTLGGNSLKILAADSVTIFNNVVVTIGGPNPADVYVNFVGGVPNANYTGFGGNGTTTGTFAGAGANNPQPLANAPPFGPSPPAPITTRARIHPRPPVTTRVINVSSSDELLALLDDFAPGRGERFRTPGSERGRHGRNASRFNAAAYLNAARRAMDRRTASTPAMRRLPQ